MATTGDFSGGGGAFLGDYSDPIDFGGFNSSTPPFAMPSFSFAPIATPAAQIPAAYSVAPLDASASSSPYSFPSLDSASSGLDLLYGPGTRFNANRFGGPSVVSGEKESGDDDKSRWYHDATLYVGLAGILAGIYEGKKNLREQKREADKARANANAQAALDRAHQAAMQDQRLNQGGGAVDTSGAVDVFA